MSTINVPSNRNPKRLPTSNEQEVPRADSAPDGGIEVAHPTTRSHSRRPLTPTGGSYDFEAVVGELCALWDAIERVEPSGRLKLYKQITEGIEKLRKRVE